MFIKTAIALALVTATASGALAQTKKQHSTNPAHDVYSTSGRYIGSDPDSRVRMQLPLDRAE